MSTLEEAFLWKKPNVSNFRIFGSSVYYHVSEEARKNLELTTKLGIFVGYIDTPHNHRVYLSSLKMKVVRRDVNFDEDKAMGVLLRGRFSCSLIKSFWLQRKNLRKLWGSHK